MTDRLEEVEQAAYSAFIYGLPMVENYAGQFCRAFNARGSRCGHAQ